MEWTKDDIRLDHERCRAFYKALGLEKMFFRTFWDGFDNFDDYWTYGDMFPHLEIPKCTAIVKREA